MALRIAALVPMRAHNQRVPDKNIRPFAGRPLYHHILETLLACPEIAGVWIDTDSEVIAAEAPRLFERVHIIERPQHLRADTTPMNNILLHDVTCVDADYYLQTHSTNPLLRAGTISRAIGALLSSPAHDSLFSVTPHCIRLWSTDGAPLNHDPDVLLRTQDLQPYYEENSNLYIFQKPILEQRRNRIGYAPLLFEIDREEAWDIDEMLDFEIAEFLFKRRQARDQTAD
jgi:CMP-N-acetylneuraminic acid synthetase